MSRNANNAQHFQGYVLFLNLFTNLRMPIVVPKWYGRSLKEVSMRKCLEDGEEFRKRGEKKHGEEKNAATQNNRKNA